MVLYERIGLKNDYQPLHEGSQINIHPSFLKQKVKQLEYKQQVQKDQRVSNNKYFIWFHMSELVLKMTIHPYMRGLRSISTHLS
jgi:hypothetical protein